MLTTVNSTLTCRLFTYLYTFTVFVFHQQMSLSPQAKCKTENSGVYITFKDT